jgi:hypothetical protein
MKTPLPAKYAKMTVCTFWILKQLKDMGMLTEEQMTEAAEEFNLTKENEDQMLYFKDLVENFKDHETYLKMYANVSKKDEDDEAPAVAPAVVEAETEAKKIKDKKLEKIEEEEESNMIRQMMMMYNQHKQNEMTTTTGNDIKSEVVHTKKIKITIKKSVKVV